MQSHSSAFPGVSLRSTPGYHLASLRDTVCFPTMTKVQSIRDSVLRLAQGGEDAGTPAVRGEPQLARHAHWDNEPPEREAREREKIEDKFEFEDEAAPRKDGS